MTDLVELRCKYCGAPLEREDIESDSPYVTCQSCGTTQQRMDAKKYMEQMMGQIRSWISKTIPGGYSGGAAENVDPVARHSIFVNSVKPKVDVELASFRLAFNSVISCPLIVLPFCKGEPVKSSVTPAEAFELEAKMKSVEAFAIDNDSRSVIVGGEGMANALAMILNNSKLITDTTPGRFVMMSKNFAEASDSLRKCEGYEAIASRLKALGDVCVASDMILNGDALGCSSKTEAALNELEAAKKELLSYPKLAMTLRTIDLEIGQGKTLKNVADMASAGVSKDPLKMLTLMTAVSAVEYPNHALWNRLLTKDDRVYELFGYVQDAVAAKNGGTLKICSGGGDILFPFWDVDLRYSFTAGMLSKKSVIVDENLLIPANFTEYAEALSSPNLGLTDIFANCPESSLMTKIKGGENSISGGAGIGRLTDSASDSSPGSRTIVLPLSTKTEASKLMELYLNDCAKKYPRLKLSKPVIEKLVYVPCTASSGRISLSREFAGLTPGIMGRMNTDKLIKL